GVTIMKTTLSLALLLLFFAPSATPKDSPKPSEHSGNWSGNWTLDFVQSRNLPQGLDSYNLTVERDGQELKVESSLQGDLHPAEDANGPYSPSSRGTGYPGRSGGVGVSPGVGTPGGSAGGGYPRGGTYPSGGGYPGGGGYPDDTSGYPGGPGGGPGRSSRSGNSSAASISALRIYPPSAVYKLDGTATTAKLGDSEQTEATSRAEWAKNGSELKLSLAANSDSGQKGDAIQLKEQWKFSKDGRYLIVDRNVHAPEGSGTVHLVFRRQATDSGAGASQGPSK
ncbi:MAG TPA: hypothetical protein VI455_09530, partial [Terriglobia bacterium]